MLRTHLILLVLSAALCLAVGCGTKRRYGDEGGTPVTMRVTLERAFVSDMKNRQGSVGVGVGAGISSGGGSSIGTGVGLSFSSTTVYLVGGDGPGQGQVFRKEIEWGESSFSVPLMPGRTLHLTVQVEGGRHGWEAIGAVEIPRSPAPTVDVVLGASGPKLTAGPVAATTTTTTTTTVNPPATPSATTANPPAAPGTTTANPSAAPATTKP